MKKCHVKIVKLTDCDRAMCLVRPPEICRTQHFIDTTCSEEVPCKLHPSKNKVCEKPHCKCMGGNCSNHHWADHCLGGCGYQAPYGFVPEADCPVHDVPYVGFMQQIGPGIPFSPQHPCSCGATGPHLITDKCVPAEVPMGVSQWRNHGKKFGYEEFWRGEILKAFTARLRGDIVSAHKTWQFNEIEAIIDVIGESLDKELKL